MTVAAVQVVVGPTATRLTPSGDPDGSSAAIKLVAGSPVFVGGPDVTTASGWPLTEPMGFDLFAGEALYGVVATATGTVAVVLTGR